MQPIMTFDKKKAVRKILLLPSGYNFAGKGPLIANVEVNNNGSASQAGYTQWMLVKIQIKRSCFSRSQILFQKKITVF